jgi:hypothetical protein
MSDQSDEAPDSLFATIHIRLKRKSYLSGSKAPGSGQPAGGVAEVFDLVLNGSSRRRSAFEDHDRDG